MLKWLWHPIRQNLLWNIRGKYLHTCAEVAGVYNTLVRLSPGWALKMSTTIRLVLENKILIVWSVHYTNDLIAMYYNILWLYHWRDIPSSLLTWQIEPSCLYHHHPLTSLQPLDSVSVLLQFYQLAPCALMDPLQQEYQVSDLKNINTNTSLQLMIMWSCDAKPWALDLPRRFSMDGLEPRSFNITWIGSLGSGAMASACSRRSYKTHKANVISSHWTLSCAYHMVNITSGHSLDELNRSL